MRRRWSGGEVARALVAVLIARTAVNGGMRVVYPFLPEIARGLGISLAAAGTLVGVRALMGLTAPLIARVAERHGRRTLILAGVASCLLGCIVLLGAPASDGGGDAGGVPVVAVALVGFLLLGVAKPAFDVPMQAWFGERVPYARRGRVLGATELTWALSLLVTVPASGLLIAATGWRAPFALVGVLAAVGLVAVARLMAPDRPAEHVRRPLRLDGPRRAAIGVALLFSLGAELAFVVYGAWLEDDFGLTVTAIGFFTLIVVASELAGEGLVTGVADRLGLRRAIFAGLTTAAVAYAALGLVGGLIAAAVVVVVVWFVAFEVTIVATIPFVSELAAESRDRLLALMIAAIAVGRTIGAFLGPSLYQAGGVGFNGLAAAGCTLLAALLLTRVPSPPSAMPSTSPTTTPITGPTGPGPR